MSRPAFEPSQQHPGTAVLAPPQAWSRTFPGTSDQVGEARRFLAAILSGHPATDNAVTCLGEICANAIQHSRSGQPGGRFTVRLRRSGAATRIEVTDEGGPQRPQPPGDPEHGRGLTIVRALSGRLGSAVKGPPECPNERTVWFEVGSP